MTRKLLFGVDSGPEDFLKLNLEPHDRSIVHGEKQFTRHYATILLPERLDALEES